MKFGKLFAVALAFGAALTLTACLGGGPAEPTRYYTVGVENIGTAGNGNSQKTVQVRKFSIDPAYQRANIVYRESAYTFMFYDLDLWASRPDQMLLKAATKYVEQSKLFATANAAKAAKPDYEILCKIDAIEEVDEGSDRYGHLNITLTFRKTEGDAIVEKEYDERMAMEGSEPQHVAMAISKLYGKFMGDFLQNVAQNMGE